MALSSQAFATAIRKHYPSLVVPTKCSKTYWIICGKAIKESGYTVEDAEALGLWLSKQRWITEPMSLKTVALKGGEWLAKIAATTKVKQAKVTAAKEAEDEQWVDLEGLQ